MDDLGICSGGTVYKCGK